MRDVVGGVGLAGVGVLLKLYGGRVDLPGRLARQAGRRAHRHRRCRSGLRGVSA
ncbi:hypothetical protein ACU686_24990 [Yinghuangia aomiensis]